MAGQIKSEEELRALIAGHGGVQPLQAPQFYASQFQVLWTANTCSIVFLQPRPAMVAPGTEQQSFVGAMEAVAIIHMSPQAAKDLAVVMGPTVADYEKHWGAMETEYTRSIAKPNPKPMRGPKSKAAAKPKD